MLKHHENRLFKVTGFTLAGTPFSVSLRSQLYGEKFHVKESDGYRLGFVQGRVVRNT